MTLRSFMSLEKVDDYGMYHMTYYGDYGFDEFLEIGAGLCGIFRGQFARWFVFRWLSQ